MEKNTKLVILVLACLDEKYAAFDKACRETWVNEARAKGIRVIFYYGGSKPDFRDDNIYLDVDDSYDNLTEKLLKALEVLESSGISYDCIYRTNHSSSIDIDGMLRFYEEHAAENFYAGVPVPYNYGLFQIPLFPRFQWYRSSIWSLCKIFSERFASGCGFFLSKSNVQKLLESKKDLAIADDVFVARSLRRHGIHAQPVPRIDFENSNTPIFLELDEKGPEGVFHFRNYSENREMDVQRMYELSDNNYTFKKLGH